MAERVVRSLNPFSGQVYKTFEFFSPAQTEQALEASRTAYLQFKALSFAERSSKLLGLSRVIKANQKELANLVTYEMGKPINSALAEVQKTVDCFEYYATHSERLLAPSHIPVSSGRCYVTYEPIGPLLVISPFNFPMWLPFKASIPQLMLGNTIILKHDEGVPRLSLLIQELVEQAGLQGVFQSVFLNKEGVRQVVNDSRVKGVSITGSVAAGKAVGAIAAGAMKKCVLELGGSDPCLILPDADLDFTVASVVAGRLAVSGQVCISPKRYIVHSSVAPAFIDKLVSALGLIVKGDPADPTTQLGPMAREDLINKVHSQVEASVSEGATLIRGGQILPNSIYDPAVLTGVTRKMTVFTQETFGPVFPIITCDSVGEMIEVANDTDFGLSAMIFTGDTSQAENAIVPHLEAGMCFINQCSLSLIPVPFGGIKQSGIGKDLGEQGIKEFANIKSVFIKE